MTTPGTIVLGVPALDHNLFPLPLLLLSRLEGFYFGLSTPSTAALHRCFALVLSAPRQTASSEHTRLA